MIHWNLIATFILRNVLWFLLQLIDHEVHESNEVLGGGLGLGLGGSGLWPGGPSLAESPGADLHLSSPHPVSVPPEPGMGKWGSRTVSWEQHQPDTRLWFILFPSPVM